MPVSSESKAKFVYCQRSLLVNVVWVFRPARQLRIEDVAAAAADVAVPVAIAAYCLWASYVLGVPPSLETPGMAAL